jgi:hypothetical protein
MLWTRSASVPRVGGAWCDGRADSDRRAVRGALGHPRGRARLLPSDLPAQRAGGDARGGPDVPAGQPLALRAGRAARLPRRAMGQARVRGPRSGVLRDRRHPARQRDVRGGRDVHPGRRSGGAHPAVRVRGARELVPHARGHGLPLRRHRRVPTRHAQAVGGVGRPRPRGRLAGRRSGAQRGRPDQPDAARTVPGPPRFA